MKPNVARAALDLQAQPPDNTVEQTEKIFNSELLPAHFIQNFYKPDTEETLAYNVQERILNFMKPGSQ